MSRHIALCIGDRSGCVVAGPHAVAFVGGDDPVMQAIVARLVELATDPSDAVEQAERLLGDGGRARPPCVVVSLAPDAVVVVHGEPGVVVHDRGDGPTRQLASAPGMPLRTNLAAGATLVVGAATRHQSDDTTDRLVIGTVAADGFSLVDETEHIDETVMPSDDDGPEPGLESKLDDERIDRWAAPVPPAVPPSIPAGARRLSVLGGRTSEAPTIEGIMCSRQHFNDPRARFCGSCGIAMHHASIVMVRRPRPTLGQLVFDTGETFQLADDVVVGRNAGDDSLVTGGDARSLVPSGDTSALSRTHAEIRVRGWDVVLTDRSSLNGTFVWERPAQRWRRLEPGSGETLRIGDVVAFGRRTATFESSVRPA